MNYYTEVFEDQPKNRIDYCFKCRIIELCSENSPKFKKINDVHHDLFQAYLSGSALIPESKIRDILTDGGFDFKLKKPSYLVHEYTGDSFASDIISGFSSDRYNSDSLFSLIVQEEKIHVHNNHSVSGGHTREDIKLNGSQDFAGHAIDIFREIDLEKYGEDLMDCACTCSSRCTQMLMTMLIDSGVKFPFNTLCKVAATDIRVFEDMYESFKDAFSIDKEDLVERNLKIAKTYDHVHPEHKRIGLNILDIIVLLNKSPDISICARQPTLKAPYLPKLPKEDLHILTTSLKFWLDNIRDEKEFELIQEHIKHLEKRGYKINLFD